MDLITLDRIKFMHPRVRTEVLNAYKHINEKLLGKGVRLRFAYTLRTNAEQDALYVQGRTKLFDANGKRLGVVTNAKGGQSVHNYGLAFDIVILLDKDGDGKFESASWDIKSDNDRDGVADWMEIVKYMRSLGWVWGGDWASFTDYPHFEKTYGHTWKTLKALYDAGKVTEEVIDGKTYKWVKI